MSLDDLRDRLLNGVDKIFSRKMLGSVLVGAATSNAIDYAIIAGFPSAVAKALWWVGLWAVFLLLFVYWARIEGFTERLDEEIDEEIEEMNEQIDEALEG